MNTDFQKLYQSLNSGQRAAVDAIEGPVMVIAGPGTGKTQILASRILNILEKTDASAENILCLTYTEAGSTAMRKRLSQFMGAEAYKVNIYTFHGLCNRIIQEYPGKFAQRELRVMDDLEKLELMNEVIREIPSHSVIKNYQDDPGILRMQLGKLFQFMQNENYDLALLEQMISQLSDETFFKEAFPDLVYKKTSKWGEAGSVKTAKFEEYKTDWQKLIEAAALYEVYQNKKKKNGVYEFSDMIHWVVDALKTDSELLSIYQEKFQYILVDEYQDTSGVQNTIIYKLIEFWGDNPNCFVVGDDDQSIYAFQGARVSNMLEFAHIFKNNIVTIPLTENYRSTQTILDGSMKVIENNQQRLVNQIPDISKTLTSVNPSLENPGNEIKIQSFKNRFHEATAISSQIKQLIQSGTTASEIAVIYAKHAMVEELADMMKQEEIPFVLARSVDILQEPIIIQLCKWLTYLSLESEMAHKGEYLLYEILHSEMYDISPYEVAAISVEIYSRKKENLRWRDYLAEYNSKPLQSSLFEPEKRQALRKLWANVEEWLKNASSRTVPQLVHDVISTGGFLGYSMQHNDREWLMEVLHTFINFMTNMAQKKPFVTLSECMEDLEKMKNNNIAIPLEKRIGSHDGVILTTAHSSKGLEFEHVFIIGAEQQAWEKDRASSLPFKLGKLFEGINATLKKEKEEEENMEERRRLFYVAMTRAKKQLSISYTNHKIDAKSSDLQPTRFLIELTDGAAIEETQLPKEQLLTAESLLLFNNHKPAVKLEDSNWLRKQVESFKFSPSTLYDILDCGLKFYFGRLVRVPSSPSSSLGYGLAVHDTLTRLIEEGVSNKTWPDNETFISWFEYEMFKRRSSFTKISYESRLEQGRNQLPQYYQSRKDYFKSHQAIILERWFETSINGTIVGGKVDKLIFNGNDATIVDYKTGNSKNAEKQFRAPSPKSIAEGKLPPKYWFQLGIYMLIINNQQNKDWKAAMAIIDSLEKNENNEFPIFKQTYTDEELEYLKSRIMIANDMLKNLEFLNGCGKPDCQWCEFARQTGQTTVSVPEELEETN